MGRGSEGFPGQEIRRWGLKEEKRFPDRLWMGGDGRREKGISRRGNSICNRTDYGAFLEVQENTESDLARGG